MIADLCAGGTQGSNDFASARADSGPSCRPAYSPIVAESVIGIAEVWRTHCSNAKIIMRGLSIYGAGSGTWPNLYTVVRHLRRCFPAGSSFPRLIC